MRQEFADWLLDLLVVAELSGDATTVRRAAVEAKRDWKRGIKLRTPSKEHDAKALRVLNRLICANDAATLLRESLSAADFTTPPDWSDA